MVNGQNLVYLERDMWTCSDDEFVGKFEHTEIRDIFVFKEAIYTNLKTEINYRNHASETINIDSMMDDIFKCI